MLRFSKLEKLFDKWKKLLYPNYPRDALTAQGWNDWAKIEKNSPSRYFLANTVPDFILYKLLNPISKLDDLLWKFKWRYVKKHQYNIIRTELEPAYYDQDTLLLYGMFAVLCSYVEEGREHLEWSAFSGECKGSQEDNAKEALFLYDWWKTNYNKRPDEYEISGVSACHEEHDKILKELGEDDLMAGFTDIGMTKDLLKKRDIAHKKLQKIEKNWVKEEEEMMLRLVKIKKSMWI